MTKLYRHRPWLPLSKLAASWSAELEVDQDELATLLLEKMLKGDVDDLDPDPELNNSNRGVIIVDLETGEVSPVRGPLVRNRLLNTAGVTLPGGAQFFYETGSIGLTRQATLKLAAAFDWRPPSYWKPATGPTRTATGRTKEVFRGLVQDCTAQGKRMTQKEAHSILTTFGEKISYKQFFSMVWKPVAPDGWQQTGRIPDNQRVDLEAMIDGYKHPNKRSAI